MSAQPSFARVLADDLNTTEGSSAPAIDNLSLWRRFGSDRRYTPGEELFRQGGAPHGVCCIGSGYVKLSAVDEDGRELIVGLRGAGVVLGVSAVILQESYRVSATAVTDCESSYISAGLFVPLLKADARFSWLIQREQSRHSSQLLSHIMQLGFRSARNRLGELLWQLISATSVSEHVREAHLSLPLKQWEVAQLIAVTPEHLNRLVKQMQQEGILRWTKDRITVFDFKRLREPSSL